MFFENADTLKMCSNGFKKKKKANAESINSRTLLQEKTKDSFRLKEGDSMQTHITPGTMIRKQNVSKYKWLLIV